METQAAQSPLRSRGELIERASGSDASGIGVDYAASSAKHFVWRLERVAAMRGEH